MLVTSAYRAQSVVCFLLLSVPVAAQVAQRPQEQVLVILVRDRESGAALRDVTLVFPGRAGGAVTDSDGRASISVRREMRYAIETRRIGYQTARIEIPAANGDTTRVEFGLTALAQRLPDVTVPGEREEVVSRLAPFEARRKRNAGGSFITQQDLERWQTTHLTDALRRVPGVWIIDSLDVRLAASSRGRKPDLKKFDVAPCIMRVGVDGQIREWGFALDAFPVNEIHGVEVYPGPATIPAQFGGLRKDAYCGLVMIWTRAK
jgi:hypothetical protein